ncbi:polysaccharide biosynthesis C-terminal domain-containing protein [Lactobacillus delbrueckii subsp. bulgaricus]
MEVDTSLSLGCYLHKYCTFLGTIFTASKRTASIMVTTVLGAIANVILTLILIRIIGSNGAAMANALSFLLVSTCTCFLEYLGLAYSF